MLIENNLKREHWKHPTCHHEYLLHADFPVITSPNGSCRIKKAGEERHPISRLEPAWQSKTALDLDGETHLATGSLPKVVPIMTLTLRSLRPTLSPFSIVIHCGGSKDLQRLRVATCLPMKAVAFQYRGPRSVFPLLQDLPSTRGPEESLKSWYFNKSSPRPMSS